MQVLELFFCFYIGVSNACYSTVHINRVEYPENILCWQAAQVIAAQTLPKNAHLLKIRCLDTSINIVVG